MKQPQVFLLRVRNSMAIFINYIADSENVITNFLKNWKWSYIETFAKFVKYFPKFLHKVLDLLLYNFSIFFTVPHVATGGGRHLLQNRRLSGN